MKKKLDTATEVTKIGMGWTIIFIGIGVGMIAWLSYFMTHHQWERQLTQEKREVTWVGEKALPVAPLKVTVKNSGCLRIDRASVNSDDFTVFIQRVCGKPGDYAEFHWRELANNVVIASDWENWKVDEVGKGETLEFKPNSYPGFSVDPRATEFILETRQRQ